MGLRAVALTFTLTIALLFPHSVCSQYRATCFELQNSNIKNITIALQTDHNTSRKLNIANGIFGFSISGSAVLRKPNSFVRVILRDIHNYDYLVYELFPMLSLRDTIQFYNTCIETKKLDCTHPSMLIVETNNALLAIDTLHYSTKASKDGPDNTQMLQANYIANMLNRNLEERGMTWRAGVTPIATMSYEEKKNLFGDTIPMLYGFDYYKSGIFIMPNTNSNVFQSSLPRDNDSFVSEWDWRNRHGKNWMTGVKSNWNCRACWAFSTIGVLEAYTNLYYNHIFNINLSEQELVSCIPSVSCNSGGTAGLAFAYAKNNGIVCESCMPYMDYDVDCFAKCQNPPEKLLISNYGYMPVNSDTIKKHLIISPVTFGVYSWAHTMTLAGYKTISLGDIIKIVSGSMEIELTIDSTNISWFPNKTVWLVKNSWGVEWGENGYAYIYLDDSNISSSWYTKGIITYIPNNDSNIEVTDADGDGYYYWGIGSKPSHCPSWVPDISDGDDSDINFGPMDEYGNVEQLSDGLTIKTPLLYSGNQTLSCRLGIVSGGVLTITGTTTMSGNAIIRVCEGGKLIIDGGTILYANLVLVPGCTVVLRNGAVVNMAIGNSFHAPIGAVVNIESGEIHQ